MNLVITGASGFIGSELVERLGSTHDLKLLTRQRPKKAVFSRTQWIVWEPGAPGEWERCVEGADGIINLAGEPIANKRWSSEQKDRIRFSRVNTHARAGPGDRQSEGQTQVSHQRFRSGLLWTARR